MLEYLKHNETSQPKRPYSFIHPFRREIKGKEMEGSPRKKSPEDNLIPTIAKCGKAADLTQLLLI
jgi:hypothetical protein